MRNLISLHKGMALIILTIFLSNRVYAFEPETNNKPAILQVSPEQFKQLQASENVDVYVAQNDNSITPGEHVQKFLTENKNKKKNTPPKETRSSGGNGLGNFGGGSGKGTGALVLIVFAVVGTVILIAWVPYFPTFLYGAITGSKDYDYISMFTFNYLGLLGMAEQDAKDSPDYKESRKGTMFGGRYSFILKKKKKENFFQKSLGISAEFGNYQFEDRNEISGDNYKYRGQYWLVGPSIILGAGTGDNYTYFFKTDLMAGGTLDHQVGMALRGDLTMNLVVDEVFFIGLGFGALYMSGNHSDGIIHHINDLAIHAVGNVGFFF